MSSRRISRLTSIPDDHRWKIFRHLIAVVAPLMTDEDLLQYDIQPTQNEELLPLFTCEYALVRISPI